MAVFTLQYVYELSDFEQSGGNQAPPNERGAMADGTPPFNLQITEEAVPQQLEISDTDDNGFDEILSGGQTLNSEITLNGVTYPAGSKIVINYEIITDDGFSGFSITIGANNSGNNTTTAFVTTEPMQAGQQYQFTSEFNIGRGERDYADFACFADDTLIRCEHGDVAVQNLRDGDRVLTESGPKPILKVLSRKLSQAALKQAPNMQPIRLVAGSLGFGLPSSDLLLSPQHRVLVNSNKHRFLSENAGVLVPAKKLLDWPGIYTDTSIHEVAYYHVLFDTHEVIFANNAPTESLFLGEFGLATLNQLQRIELLGLFPELARPEFSMPQVRPEIGQKQLNAIVADLVE